MEPIWTFESKLDLSLKDIEDILFNIPEGEFTKNNVPFILSGKGNGNVSKKDGQFIVQFENGYKQSLAVNRDQHTLTVKGQWWYCGVFTIYNEYPRTRISLQVFNIAESSGWLVPMMIWNKKVRFWKNFDQFVETLNKKAR
jgi:hypothetical protein